MDKEKEVIKKGTIFKNLWAGYDYYFIYLRKEGDMAKGIKIHNAHNKIETDWNCASLYYHDLANDREHFPIIEVFEGIDLFMQNALLGLLPWEHRKELIKNKHLDDKE